MEYEAYNDDQNNKLEVLALAKTKAETLNKLTNGGGKVKEEEDEEDVDHLMATLSKVEGRLATVAWRRAQSSGRPFKVVLAETRLEFYLREAEIFEREMPVDPRVAAMAKAVVEEEERESVCGVCQEEFEVGEEVSAPACMHKFHGFCLWKWLSDHNTCPLCRFHILP